MTQPTHITVNPRQVITILKKRRRLWIVSTAVMTLMALIYAAVRPDTWRASQAVLVRDEAIGNLSRQGRFDSADAMKVAQETVLEIARNPNILSASLVEVGPPGGYPAKGWPTQDQVAELRRVIEIKPPKGAEFGTTEVIYLTVESASRRRAIDLASAVCRHVEAGLKDMRNTKALSVITELERTMNLAEADLADATGRLETMESQVGSDLGELRVLNDSGTGEGNLRMALNEIENELRQARAELDARKEQEKLLAVSQSNPVSLVATPNHLLESQPALRRLKDGLVDAQLRKAELLGKMSESHPLVQAAIEAEEEVRQHLHQELEIAVRGLGSDLEISRAKVDSLKEQAAGVKGRLDRLAGLRAKYGNLVAEVRQQSAMVDQARRARADARASQSAAQSASLIARIDEPQTGNRPIGMGRISIVLTGMAAGLATGFGLVLLTLPTAGDRGRRWTDFFRSGRRASDRASAGRRQSDPQNANRRAGGATSAGRRAGDHPSSGRRATDEQPVCRRSTDPDQPPRKPDEPVDGRRAADRTGFSGVPGNGSPSDASPRGPARPAVD